MGNAELDKHILAASGEHWHKVAMVLCRAAETTGLEDKHWGMRRLSKRLNVLIRKGQLLVAGNPYNWRASEVRLP